MSHGHGMKALMRVPCIKPPGSRLALSLPIALSLGIRVLEML